MSKKLSDLLEAEIKANREFRSVQGFPPAGSPQWFRRIDGRSFCAWVRGYPKRLAVDRVCYVKTKDSVGVVYLEKDCQCEQFG